MTKYKYVTELLAAANAIENPEERARLLASNMREPVRKILACIHNPDIHFFKPDKMTYSTKSNKMGISDTTLEIETKRLYIFQKNYNLDEKRKNMRLLQLLEALPNEEAEFLYNHILPKKNPYKNLQKPFFNRYFPDIVTHKLERN